MSETSTSASTETSRSPRLREKGRLMSSSEIERTLVRLAHEIVERNNGASNIGLVGIKRRGVPLAQRVGKLIETIERQPVDTGVLDISFYRDDLSTRDVRPVVDKGDIGFDIEGRDIILMDDVLYTGRTIRAALDALFDHGRPTPRPAPRPHRPRPSRASHRSTIHRPHRPYVAAARSSRSSSARSTTTNRLFSSNSSTNS